NGRTYSRSGRAVGAISCAKSRSPEAGLCSGIGHIPCSRTAHRRSRRCLRAYASSGDRKVSVDFQLRNVGMRYVTADILRGVTVDLSPPKLTAIVGPNGAGKSTLLGILGGLREGYLGECRFDGTEVSKWSRRDYARRVSLVPQTVRIEFPFTAEQVVLMGRTPHATSFFESAADRNAVGEAME